MMVMVPICYHDHCSRLRSASPSVTLVMEETLQYRTDQTIHQFLFTSSSSLPKIGVCYHIAIEALLPTQNSRYRPKAAFSTTALFPPPISLPLSLSIQLLPPLLPILKSNLPPVTNRPQRRPPRRIPMKPQSVHALVRMQGDHLVDGCVLDASDGMGEEDVYDEISEPEAVAAVPVLVLIVVFGGGGGGGGGGGSRPVVGLVEGL